MSFNNHSNCSLCGGPLFRGRCLGIHVCLLCRVRLRAGECPVCAATRTPSGEHQAAHHGPGNTSMMRV